MCFILQQLRMAHPCSELCAVNYCNTVRAFAFGFRFPANRITAGERNMLGLSGVHYRMSDFCKCTALSSFKDITVTVYLPPCVRLMTVNFYCFEICAPIRAPHGQQGTVKDYKGHLGTMYKRGVCKIKNKNTINELK